MSREFPKTFFQGGNWVFLGILPAVPSPLTGRGETVTIKLFQLGPAYGPAQLWHPCGYGRVFVQAAGEFPPPAIEETRAFPFSLSFCEKGGGRETENVLKRDSQGEGAGNGNLRRRGVARLPG